MTRDKKEKFIKESWKEFESVEDSVSLPNLANLSEKEIDTMVEWYDYLWEK
ncbi:hypothetical protein QUF99_01780 [Bacillus sp. DX4.1]|uniref:hypothetical protein n=1 Tax=Bacillus sp. DX4.1 TaxID=3055867 RepID=UPI0025A1ED4B|nr:hypothetical protein [Bacillus sp. DX4.1]MDM5186192.1 hypothetical protein [Bacillus sp. DX4.1]